MKTLDRCGFDLSLRAKDVHNTSSFLKDFTMHRSNREAARTLFSTAFGQGGYFTAKQAKEAGYGYQHLEYHISTGNFERVDHGLYRLTTIPPGEHDDLRRLALWSRNQKDVPQAVVSHESALVLHEMSELLPTTIHLTVPTNFRKPPLRGCVLHKSTLGPKDIEEREGFLVTTPLRTLLDVSLGEVSTEQLEKAVSEAISRGLVRRGKLLEEARQHRRAKRLRLVLGNSDGECSETINDDIRWQGNSAQAQRLRHRSKLISESEPKSKACRSTRYSSSS